MKRKTNSRTTAEKRKKDKFKPTEGHARNYCQIAHEYAVKAIGDPKNHCKWNRLACQRYLDDLKRAEKKGCPFYFDPYHGNDVCDFIEKLPHTEGSWDTPEIHLESAQIFILVCMFGFRNLEGRRRFTAAYIEMARKGAKSTLTAGIGLYCLACEDEVGPQVIIGATTGEQANKVFKPAKSMVQKTPDLREAFGIEAWARSITCAQTNGFIQTINAKSSTQDGWNPHVGILDEVHAHKDRGLYDVIRSAFGARKAPLLWLITTAGYNLQGVGYEQRTIVTKILQGTWQADHYFGIIFTIDEGDDPFDEANWKKANPLIGVTPTYEDMRRYANESQVSPDTEGEFKTKRLNLWLNASGAWLNMERWLKCGDPTLSWSEFEGLECWIGADLADKDDITAAVVAAIKGDTLIFKPVFWLPEAVITAEDADEQRLAAPYRSWAKQGFLNLTPGDWIDHGLIQKQITEWRDKFNVRGIRFDQFAAAQKMATDLNEDPDNPIAAILPKNAKNYTDPAKDLEERIKSGFKRIRHDGNPVMNWMASNVVVTRKVDGSLIPKKETPTSPHKIDGIDALLMATSGLIMAPEQEKSFWEN